MSQSKLDASPKRCFFFCPCCGAQINDAVESLDGTWVKDAANKKASHWEVPTP